MPGSKFQWNLIKNANLFIHKNPVENVVYEMVAMLSRPQYVDVITHTYQLLKLGSGLGITTTMNVSI